MRMCHLIATTDAELHAMADRIGVARKWHQGDHYDVCQSKRRLALKFGAVAITWAQCGHMAVARRRTGVLPPVPEAVSTTQKNPDLFRFMEENHA
jgi:hypothetical protein